MLRRLYDWTLSLAAGPQAPRGLAVVSFVESSVFPIPPDILLIPMVLADRRKAWWFATICTIASVLGGLLGYLIGAVLFEEVARADPRSLRLCRQVRRLQRALQFLGAVDRLHRRG